MKSIKTIAYTFLLLLCLGVTASSVSAQSASPIQATIKPSATAGAVDIYFKTAAANGLNYSNVQVSIGIPNTILPAPAPLNTTVASVNSALGPQTSFTGTIPDIITNTFGYTSVSMEVTNVGGQFVYLFGFSGTSPNTAALQAGVEKLVLTVKFDNVTSEPIPDMQTLVQVPGGGNDGQFNFYTEQGGVDNTNAAAPFYNGTSATATNGGCNDYSCGSVARLNASNVLPVTYTGFTGTGSNCTASLAWQTATEQNSAYFYVQYSTDGINFTTVGRVASQNSATGASYTYSYDKLAGGTGYFRLDAVDLDGSSAYSPIVTVTGTGACSAGLIVKLSPNPTSDLVDIQGLSANSHITLLTLSGQKLAELVSGGTSQGLSLGSYAKGIYIVRVENASGAVTNIKVVKQ